MNVHELPSLTRVPEPAPLRTPLALEPPRAGSWATVWVLGLGMGMVYVWVLSAGPRGDAPGLAPALGRVLLALACLMPVIARIVTLRRGLEPTVDERFSWQDFPERRAAYKAFAATRLPRSVRWLWCACVVLGVLGWVLYVYGPLFFHP